MSLTNFPNGLSSFGFPLIGSGPVVSTGHVWFVNSVTGTDSAGRGTDPSRPFASLNFAMTQCTAANGDIVFAMPGHAETVSAAAGLNFSITGVTIVGLGNGANRPTITLGTISTATIAFASANCSLQNCIIDLTGVDAVAKGLVITADSCSVIGCSITQTGATNGATIAISIASGGTNFLLNNSTINANGAGTAGTHAILSSAAVAGLQVTYSNIYGGFTTACMGSASTNHLTNMVIEHNRFRQTNGSAKNIFNFTTSSTGVIAYNTFEGTTWSTAADVATNSTSTSLRWFQNFGFDDGAGAVSGVLVPAVGTIA